MQQNDLCGTGVALVTPFNENGAVDYTSLGKIVEHVIQGGVNYLVVMGTTGESVTISADEKKQIVEYVLEKNNNRVPVVLGIGGYDTKSVAETIQSTDLSLIDAILSVSPYYNKPSQEGIFSHYKYIADACDKPIILYNVPGRTSSNIEAETTLRLAQECKNIIAVKEASGDLGQIATIVKNKPKDFMVLSGDDALTYSILALGGCGVISVIANALPSEFSEMVKLAMDNKFSEARNIHLKLLDIMGALFEEGSPAGIKAAVHNLGLLEHNVVRLPITTASEALQNKLGKQLKQLGY